METNEKREQDLMTIVMQAFEVAHRKMLKQAKLEDRTLVIERDGKVVQVKARDL